MYGTLWHFFKNYTAPRWRRVVLNLQLPTCVALAWLISSQPYFLSQALSERVVAQMVNYNFMAFGFTIAAMTVVFAVPNARFQEYMFERAENSPQKGEGPWEDALFIMAWNGFVHFIGLVSAVFVLASCFQNKSGETISVLSLGIFQNTSIFTIFLSLQIYAVCQFLMTLLSTYFFCASYIRHARNAWARKRSGP